MIPVIGFENIDIMKFGNELRISGMIFSKGQDLYFIPVPNTDYMRLHIVEADKDDWDKLVYQLDNVETVVHAKDENGKLEKIIVRKSQRRLEEKIIWNVFRRDNYTCQYCGKNDVPLTVDHVVRWENMGQTHEDNLITACKKCNNTRGNMEIGDWLKCNYYIERVPIKFISSNLASLDKAFELPLREYKRKR